MRNHIFTIWKIKEMGNVQCVEFPNNHNKKEGKTLLATELLTLIFVCNYGRNYERQTAG